MGRRKGAENVEIDDCAVDAYAAGLGANIGTEVSYRQEDSGCRNQGGLGCCMMELSGQRGRGCNRHWLWYRDSRSPAGASSPQVWRSVSPSCRKCRVPSGVKFYVEVCNDLYGRGFENEG